MSIVELSKSLVEEPTVCWNGNSAFFLYDRNDKLLRFKLTGNSDNVEVLLVDNGFIKENFKIDESNKLSRMNQILGSFLDRNF